MNTFRHSFNALPRALYVATLVLFAALAAGTQAFAERTGESSNIPAISHRFPEITIDGAAVSACQNAAEQVASTSQDVAAQDLEKISKECRSAATMQRTLSPACCDEPGATDYVQVRIVCTCEQIIRTKEGIRNYRGEGPCTINFCASGQYGEGEIRETRKACKQEIKEQTLEYIKQQGWTTILTPVLTCGKPIASSVRCPVTGH